MTIEEAKEMLPIMEAYAEGKVIQCRKIGTCEWKDIFDIQKFSPNLYYYRIKPEPQYRPFTTQEECLNELQNHVPYGILKNKETSKTVKIHGLYTEIFGRQLKIAISNDCDNCWETANFAYYSYEFKDGTPFGIKEEIL